MKFKIFNKIKLYSIVILMVFVTIFCNSCAKKDNHKANLSAVDNALNTAGMIYNKNSYNSRGKRTNLTSIYFQSTDSTKADYYGQITVTIKVFDTILLNNNYNQDFNNYCNVSSQLGLSLGIAYNAIPTSIRQNRTLFINFSQTIYWVNYKTSAPVYVDKNLELSQFEYYFHVGNFTNYDNGDNCGSVQTQDRQILSEFKKIELLL